MPKGIPDAEWMALWAKTGSCAAMADLTGMERVVISKRNARMRKRGFEIETHSPRPGYENRVPVENRPADQGWTFPREKPLWIDTGPVVVFSDAHFNPGEPSLANKALLEVIRGIKPRAIIANGDIFDGGSIGRHPPFGWSQRPTPVQELEACIERMGEIELARPNGCELVYTIGNHDIRWERTLATQVEQFAGLQGLRLADHFSNWELTWCCPVNWGTIGATMIKHRFASSGIHAGHQALLKSGVHTVSGHTHFLGVNVWGDYRGRRYGTQTGCVADLDGPATEYTEQNPSPACSGFAVLKYQDGRLLHPELCEVIDGKAWFRGEQVA